MGKNAAATKNANSDVFGVRGDSDVQDINLDLIDENPLNEKIFSMDGIETLADEIRDNGFLGAIIVFRKPDGRYEIGSGHRRVRAMRLLDKKSIPCFIYDMPDENTKIRLLIGSNIRNRKMKPLDWARAIDAYKETLVPGVDYKGKQRKKLAEVFGIAEGQVYRYECLLRLIPELQDMADDPAYDYSAFRPAVNLSDADQHVLYDRLKNYENDALKSYTPDIVIPESDDEAGERKYESKEDSRKNILNGTRIRREITLLIEEVKRRNNPSHDDQKTPFDSSVLSEPSNGIDLDEPAVTSATNEEPPEYVNEQEVFGNDGPDPETFFASAYNGGDDYENIVPTPANRSRLYQGSLGMHVDELQMLADDDEAVFDDKEVLRAYIETLEKIIEKLKKRLK